MPLINILAEFMSHVGLHPSQKALAIGVINKAAKDIYDNPGFEPLASLREQLFQIEDVKEQLFTFPWQVGNIKAIRDFHTGIKASLVDMRPRYQTSGWQDKYLSRWEFRLLRESVFKTSSDNEAPLTFLLDEAAPEAFTIHIVGQSERASRETETITFNVGDTQKLSARAYSEVFSLTKNKITTLDLKVLDADGKELSKIPNHLFSVSYQTVEIPENIALSQQGACFIEVCYKLTFTPLAKDYDTFIADGYDDAIYWKSLEHWYAKKEDKIAEVLSARMKSEELIKNLQVSKEATVKKKIDFSPNQFHDLYNKTVNLNLP